MASALPRLKEQKWLDFRARREDAVNGALLRRNTQCGALGMCFWRLLLTQQVLDRCCSWAPTVAAAFNVSNLRCKALRLAARTIATLSCSWWLLRLSPSPCTATAHKYGCGYWHWDSLYFANRWISFVMRQNI